MYILPLDVNVYRRSSPFVTWLPCLNPGRSNEERPSRITTIAPRIQPLDEIVRTHGDTTNNNV